MIAKQVDVRSNIKKYFDIAYDGEVVFVPRKQNRNIVIMSETEYNRLSQAARVSAYAQELVKDDHKRDRVSERRTEGVRANNLEKLKRIRSMKDNWNGNGAPSFPKAIMDKVEAVVKALDIQPEIFPNAMGTIQLEYDNSRRDHMEIEIGQEDLAEVFIVRFNGEELYEDIMVAPGIINERVAAFYG